MRTDTTSIDRATQAARDAIQSARKTLTQQLDQADTHVLTASLAAKRGDLDNARRALSVASELLYGALETDEAIHPLLQIVEGGSHG